MVKQAASKLAKRAVQKTVLVTGANRGIGFELVRQYAGDGWRVIAACRQPEKAKALQRLVAAGASIAIFQLDVTDDKSVRRLAAGLAKHKIDLLINNAGIIGKGAFGYGTQQRLGSLDFKVWEQVMAVNATGVARMINAFYKNIARSQLRLIINLSARAASIKTQAELLDSLAFKSSKVAQNMVSATAAYELAPHKIAVVSVCPGRVKTNQFTKTDRLPADAALLLRKTISKLTLKDSGRFVDRFGKTIPW